MISLFSLQQTIGEEGQPFWLPFFLLYFFLLKYFFKFKENLKL